jgi:hypothetical protein
MQPERCLMKVSPVLAFKDFEIVDHLMAMRLTDFDKKVPGDLAI